MKPECILIWEGILVKPNFSKWMVVNAQSEDDGRRVLIDHNCEHFWTYAQKYDMFRAGVGVN